MAAAAAITPPPLFGTVLVARTPQDSPSPLELQMRNSSGRFRIVQKLSGGAHLLLPGSETTIAIRAYFSKDLNDDDDADTVPGNSSMAKIDARVPDLVAFRNAFKYPVVFFILEPEAQQKQLSDIHSFVNQAQLVMNNQDGTRASGQQKEGSGRVFIVPNASSAIDILSSVIQTLTPARRDLKKQFHESVKVKNFVVSRHNDNGNNDDDDRSMPRQASAARHVTTAFRNWANRFELPVGEADVLMSRFGSISGIGTANLSGAPLYDSTKEKLHAFFGSVTVQRASVDSTCQVSNGHHHGAVAQYPQQGVMPGMMSTGPFQEQQQQHQYPTEYQMLSHDYSMTEMAPVEMDDMRVSDYAGDWLEQQQIYGTPANIRATPQLISQQFVPRSHPAGGSSSFAMMQQQRMMDSTHQQQQSVVQNDGNRGGSRPRLLLSQFRHSKGNAIRPFSSYSTTADESRAAHVPGGGGYI